MILSDTYYNFIALDLPAILTALACAVMCAVLGSFLLLRKASLMGDAISHAVLPGIVLGFLFSHSRGALVVFIGAALAGIVTALLIEMVREYGKVDASASMGVVFSSMFALGVVLMEQAAARSVDLDADCLLHGQLETIFWTPPREVSLLTNLSIWQTLPNEVWISWLVLGIVAGLVWLFYKELVITSFDPALADALGFSARRMHYLLMILVAFAVVASFKAVGSILVIAMLVCPVACARLFADRLHIHLVFSVIFALLSVLLGYGMAAFLPLYLGFDSSFNAAGMMASVSGVLLFLSIIFAPQYGLLSRWVRSVKTKMRIMKEDLLGTLYRAKEQNVIVNFNKVVEAFGKEFIARLVISRLKKQGHIVDNNGVLNLTSIGEQLAKTVIRNHRLWESYLVKRLGLRVDHVHERAEQLEHYTEQELQEKLAKIGELVKFDPHGQKIP
jgi:manganese/zinc/iron transport system permease protein